MRSGPHSAQPTRRQQRPFKVTLSSWPSTQVFTHISIPSSLTFSADHRSPVVAGLSRRGLVTRSPRQSSMSYERFEPAGSHP